MTTGFEGVGLKAVIDGLVGLFNRSRNKRVTAKGKHALGEAMRELLMIRADVRSAEAKVRIAKAAGIIEDVELAEDWVAKHKAASNKPIARKPIAKKPVTKKPVAKKPVAKKAAGKHK